MKKKISTGKMSTGKVFKLEKAEPNPAKAREGKAKKKKNREVKAEILKKARAAKSTKKEVREGAFSRSSNFTQSSSSARGVFYGGKKSKSGSSSYGRARVKKVDTPAQNVGSSVREVYSVGKDDTNHDIKRGTLRETGESEKKRLRVGKQGTRTIPPSKVAPLETKKSQKKGETIGATKKESASKKKQYDAHDTTHNAQRLTIDETEEIDLSTAPRADQNENALYPDRHINISLNRTLKRIIRKGRKLRKDARPPSIQLTKSICNLIRLGNYPEVVARAFGIQNNTFRTWVLNGFTDINNGDNTPYAKFVIAVDAADAQSEVLDVAQINNAADGWQAKAWIRERKSFQRWGMRALQLSGDINRSLNPVPADDTAPMEPEIAAEVLTALEEAGIVAQSGFEHLSGIPEESPIPSRADDSDDIETAIMEP